MLLTPRAQRRGSPENVVKHLVREVDETPTAAKPEGVQGHAKSRARLAPGSQLAVLAIVYRTRFPGHTFVLCRLA